MYSSHSQPMITSCFFFVINVHVPVRFNTQKKMRRKKQKQGTVYTAHTMITLYSINTYISSADGI